MMLDADADALPLGAGVAHAALASGATRIAEHARTARTGTCLAEKTGACEPLNIGKTSFGWVSSDFTRPKRNRRNRIEQEFPLIPRGGQGDGA
jgi:hypothetical protein